MVEAKIPIERLYLWKERNNDVYVENNNIHDHQIDGLRFLFKQFKKKNPGVILNFPPQCGKSVTIVLFLYAIRKLLHQPVLVLCKDTQEVEGWHHCFQQWSSFSSEDIIVEPTKALLKKQIFIKSMSDLVSFTRRSWSILVYKDDAYNGMPQFSSVNFYIWATTTDVMKDLNFLSSIYNWMCPKEKINFDHGGGDLQKCILLDAQLEDIVLRRTRITSPKGQTDSELDYCIPAKKSKKNKDATGTKIKRSKVVSKDVNVNDIDNPKMNIDKNINKNPVTSKDQDEFDVKFGNLQYSDSFVVDVKDMKVLNSDDSQTILKTDAIKPTSKESYLKPVADENIYEEKINKSTIENVTIESPSDKMEHSDDFNITNEKVTIESPTDISNDNVTIKSNKIDTEETQDDLNTPSISLKYSSTQNGDTPDLESNAIENASDNNIMSVLEENILKSVNKEIDRESSHNDGEIAQSTVTDHTNNVDSTKKELNQVTTVKYESDLDSKINEMQERAMKKFKGSFLDSIF